MSNLNKYNLQERHENPYLNVSTELLREALDSLLHVKEEEMTIDIPLEIWEIRRVIHNRLEKN
jgi:hypothetical protein